MMNFFFIIGHKGEQQCDFKVGTVSPKLCPF